MSRWAIGDRGKNLKKRASVTEEKWRRSAAEGSEPGWVSVECFERLTSCDAVEDGIVERLVTA